MLMTAGRMRLSNRGISAHHCSLGENQSSEKQVHEDNASRRWLRTLDSRCCAKYLLNLDGIEVRKGSESRSEEVRILCEAHQCHGLQNLLIAVTEGTQGIDIVLAYLGRMIGQLLREIQKRFEYHRHVRGSVIHGDLLRLRSLDSQHPNNLAMRCNAIRAEIGRRAYQENVFLLLPRKGALLPQ